MTLCAASLWASGDLELVGPGCAVPDLPGHFVRRERLEEQVNLAPEGRLTVVTGGAGAGKSVLLAGWARHRAPGMTAWLSLEAADNDSSRFWSRLVEALRIVEPDAGNNVLAAQSAGISDMGVARVLVGELAAIGPIAVVLDDLHILAAGAVSEALAYLAGHLPSSVHLIVASRQPPPLPSHRLRLSGSLNEIDEAELRFSSGEAADLMASIVGRGLPPDTIEVLMASTEGWAAGLRLAGLAMVDRRDLAETAAAFGGETHTVVEYFQREVLADLAPDIVQFMIEISVLSTLSTRGCQEVTGRAEAGEILQGLALGHLFIRPMDAGHRCFEYHPLFAQFLGFRLATQDPEVARRSHLRAAAYLWETGDGAAAVGHLVEGGDLDSAFALGAAAVARQVQCGQATEGEALLPGKLPDSYIERDPWRMYVVAAGLLCQRRTAEAARWLMGLTRSVRDTADRPLLEGRAEILWAIHDGLLWDPTGVFDHYRRASELLGCHGQLDLNVPSAVAPGHPWLGPVDSAVANHLHLVAAWGHLWLGHIDRAHATLYDPGLNANLCDPIAYLGLRAILAQAEGKLQDAYRLARAALDEAESLGRSDDVNTLAARLALVAVHRERDELDAAELQLTEGLGVCEHKNQPHWAAAFACEEIQVVMAQGRQVDALDCVGHLRHLDITHPLPERLKGVLDRVEIHCRLALRDLEGAVFILNTIPPALRSDELLARVDLCAGRPDRAEHRLNPEPNEPKAARVDIERLVLLARAQLQSGKRSRADDTLRRAIDRGRPDRYITVLLDDAAELLALLRAIAGRYPDTYLAALVDHAQRAHPSPSIEPIAQIVEPLTERERDLLSHLPSHLSQPEYRGGHVHLHQHHQNPYPRHLPQTRSRIPVTGSRVGAAARPPLTRRGDQSALVG